MCVCVFVNVYVCTRVHNPLLTFLFCHSTSLGCPTDLKLPLSYFFLGPKGGADEITLKQLLFLLSVQGQSQRSGKEGLQLAKSPSAVLGVTERSSDPLSQGSSRASVWSLYHVVFSSPCLNNTHTNFTSRSWDFLLLPSPFTPLKLREPPLRTHISFFCFQ